MESKVIASTFDSLATVFERRYIENSLPQREEMVEIYKDIPCAVSRTRSGAKYGNQPVLQELYPKLSYETKLFLPPDLDIKAGSFIKVKTLNEERNYISSGEAIRYKSHQEILISREDFA